MTDTTIEPGIYPGIKDEDYHARPELSASNMKKLLPPYVPAIFDYERKNPRPHKIAFEFGHAAHAELLGVGAEVVTVQKKTKSGEIVDADTYDTVYAKNHVTTILAQGKTPLLAKERRQVTEMVKAAKADPIASKLLAPSTGTPETSLFWTDPESGVPLRARLDFLREPDKNGRLLIVDYKTSKSADPREFAKESANYNYPISAANYVDGVLALGHAKTVEFLFVVQSKTAPYLVSVIGIKADDLDLGRRLKRKAIETFKVCTERDEWPGYSSEIHYPDLPVWWSYYAEEIAS